MPLKANLKKLKVTPQTKKSAWNGFLIVMSIVVAFFLGSMTTELKFLRNGTTPSALNDSGSVPDTAVTGELDPVSDSDHVLGNRGAKVALIEYGDFECPFCKQFHPTVQQAMAQYGDQLMWVLRQFPLDSIHPTARPSAIASECVAKLGGEDKFWSYADALFNSQDLSNTFLIGEASKLGVDITSCLNNKETESLVDEDVNSGSKAGVSGTPGNFLVNMETGEKIQVPGAVPFEQLASYIDSIL